MHHSSIDNGETVTARLYAIMSAPGALGEWHDPLSLLAALDRKYGIKVTAISTYMSSIRGQLRDFFPDRGEELQGPRDCQPTDDERKILGKGNFYRVRKITKVVEQVPMSFMNGIPWRDT